MFRNGMPFVLLGKTWMLARTRAPKTSRAGPTFPTKIEGYGDTSWKPEKPKMEPVKDPETFCRF